MDYPSCVVTSLGDPGGSAYYRILLPLLFADAKGHIQLRMPNQFAFYPIDYLKNLKPDTIVFHRTHTDPQRKYINELSHEIDLLKIYTIDDWVGKVPKESPHFEAVSKTADKEIKKAIGMCDRLIVTNELLANVYGYKKETIIIPNYLAYTAWQNIYLTNPKSFIADKQGPIRIGWSGGMGHPGDLKILKEIADILGDKVHWVFLGDIPPGFDQGNSEVHQPVSPTEYAKKLYSLNLDLALAPLLDNDFNRAKSNLRILEYGACGFPVIASNVLPYQDAPIQLLEYNATWWANEIQKKIDDPQALFDEGQKLKEWVWTNYKLEDHLVDYADALAPDGQGFRPYRPETEETIDIVITTRNQLPIVKECLTSVIESIPKNKTKVQVVVCDNASTETGMKEYLNELPNDGVDVFIQDKDYGYVINVNTGLKRNPNRDAIILNSDTIVNGDWIDRLKESAYVKEQIASVTPFTNNGTICSYPNPATSDTERGLVKFYDSVCNDLKFEETVDIPTPVGFCTYIKRTALADVGLFDPHAFGRGYGDENEWALRCQKRLWTHVLGHTVYVGHKSGASFGAERQKLMEAGAKVLVTRWQQYPQMIQQFMQQNPINNIRQQLDILAITKSSTQDRVLYIAHGFGGGLETYLQTQLRDNPGAIIIRNDLDKPGMSKMEVVGEQYYNLPPLNTRLSSIEFLKQFFSGARVTKISVQTTFGYDYNMPTWIMNLAKHMNIPYEVMLHDYWTVCPRLRMIQTTSYCGGPDVDACNQCIIDYGSGLGQVDVRDWRNLYNRFLEGASRVMAPSNDLAYRIKDHITDWKTDPLGSNFKIDVIPHETDIKIGEFPGTKKWDGKDELRVAVIGNVTPDKGSLIVRDCAQYCLDNNIPIKFVVFGSLIDNSAILKMIPPTNNLTILGQYEEIDLKTLLNLNACHLSFFPALWPETYSYTLSASFKGGLFPVAFDIGAIAERIKTYKFGKVVPFELHTDPAKIVQTLLDTAKELL